MTTSGVRHSILLTLCAAPALAGCGAAAPAIPKGLDLPTAQGTVHGTADGSMRAFLGIPFAAPPVGDNRFRAPQPPAAWSGTRAATGFGPICPQLGPTDGKYDDSADEDCLTLNVWSADAPASPRPVMVWLHGGGFVLGAGSVKLYDGANLAAAGDVVVVTVNYRLGPLGFLAHPALSAEDPASPSGNYALLDQQQALRWVRDNIAAFGGDPQRVTLFGESAGGISVCEQLVSPAARGLFQRAIVESGPCLVVRPPDRATWEAQGQKLGDALGCAGDLAAVRACLRQKSAKEVLSALPLKKELVFGDGYGWNPHVDGVVLPESPGVALAAGRFAPVPLLVGANKDEATIFFKVLGVMINSDDDARRTLAPVFSPAQIDALVAQYAVSKYPSAMDAGLASIGDAFVCDARRLARLHSAVQATFEYHFTREFPWIYPGLGAFHTAEIPYVFDNPHTFISIPEEDRPLSRAMQGYWTRFAAAGDPNPAAPTDAVAWPGYDAAGDRHLLLDRQIQVGSGLRKVACDAWDRILDLP